MKRFIMALTALVMLSSCASSERMMRLGRDPKFYKGPSSLRLVDNGQGTLQVAMDSDDSFVNLWPLFLTSGSYTSVLWPFIDYDKYGFAVRPIFNKEGADYSVLFPLSSWSPSRGDGWVLNTYWNEKRIGAFPLFNIPKKENGLTYILPVWWKNSATWGLFPLLWKTEDLFFMLPSIWYDKSYPSFGFFPAFMWNAEENGLKSVGPFWMDGGDYGIFPIAAKLGNSSYFFPLYYNDDDLFLSIPFSRYSEKYPDRKFSHNRLPFRYPSLSGNVIEKSWNWAIPFYGGTTVCQVKDDSKPDMEPEKKKITKAGLFPVFEYESFNGAIELDLLVFLGCFRNTPKNELYHLLGPIGGMYMDSTNYYYGLNSSPGAVNNREKFYAFLGSYYYNRKYLDSEKTQTAYGFAPLFNVMKSPEANRWFIPGVLSWGRHSEYGSEVDILCGLLWSYESTKTMRELPSHIYGKTDADLITPFSDHTYYSAISSYSNNFLLALIADEAVISRWKVSTPESIRKAYGILGTIYHDFKYNKITNWLKSEEEKDKLEEKKIKSLADAGLPVEYNSIEDVVAQQKIIVEKYTQIEKITQSGFLHKLGYRLVRNGENKNLWIGGGLLARQEILGDEEYLSIFEFLYRYSRNGDKKYEMIFPFITRRSDGKKSSFSFAWRLLNIEREDGKITNGHVFFIPF